MKAIFLKIQSLPSMQLPGLGTKSFYFTSVLSFAPPPPPPPRIITWVVESKQRIIMTYLIIHKMAFYRLNRMG